MVADKDDAFRLSGLVVGGWRFHTITLTPIVLVLVYLCAIHTWPHYLFLCTKINFVSV